MTHVGLISIIFCVHFSQWAIHLQQRGGPFVLLNINNASRIQWGFLYRCWKVPVCEHNTRCCCGRELLLSLKLKWLFLHMAMNVQGNSYSFNNGGGWMTYTGKKHVIDWWSTLERPRVFVRRHFPHGYQCFSDMSVVSASPLTEAFHWIASSSGHWGKSHWNN